MHVAVIGDYLILTTAVLADRSERSMRGYTVVSQYVCL